jgi:hypothetical protein
VTSNLVPATKLSDHGRGGDVQANLHRLAPKSFVSRILISKLFEKHILRGILANVMILLYDKGGEGPSILGDYFAVLALPILKVLFVRSLSGTLPSLITISSGCC